MLITTREARRLAEGRLPKVGMEKLVAVGLFPTPFAWLSLKGRQWEIRTTEWTLDNGRAILTRPVDRA